MSATLPRVQNAISVEVVATWCAKPGAFLLAGYASNPLPKSGSVRGLAKVGPVGLFRGESWVANTGRQHAFLVAIQMQISAQPSLGGALILRGARASDADFQLQLGHLLGDRDFATQLSQLETANKSGIARYLLDMASSAEDSKSEGLNSILSWFIPCSAEADGCVELVLSVPNKNIVLQGWGSYLDNTAELLIIADKVERYPSSQCEFRREDVALPYSGVLIALPARAADAIASVDRVFLLSANRVLVRRISDPRVHASNESLGQLRHLLPKLRASDTVLQLFQALARPAYTRQDTLNTLSIPVRAAIDIAVASDGGIYVSGWLLDPTNQVAAVDICTLETSVRVDEAFVRVEREDVVAAYAADPSMVPSNTNLVGFVTSLIVAGLRGSDTHFRFALKDGELGFLPIQPLNFRDSDTLERLLSSVDTYKRSALKLIKAHLAPFISRSLAGKIDTKVTPVLSGPIDRRRSIVAGLCEAVIPRALIANFLLSPAEPEEQIVFVCGPSWDELALARLQEITSFYELAANIVRVDQMNATTALHAALKHSQAQEFLIVDPAVMGLYIDDREKLFRALSKSDIVCPTLTYEDTSVRFAGQSAVEVIPTPPFCRITCDYAGIPAPLVHVDGLRPMQGGSLACFAITRDAASRLGEPRFLTEGFAEADFFLEACSAGLICLWDASVTVAAPEHDAGKPYIAQLVDGLNMASKWNEMQ